MIKIHATKKLLAKLPVNKEGFLPNDKNDYSSPSVLSENPLSGWHANLITLQRRNCILMVHDSSRFPLFIPCLTKPDFANLNWHFEDALMNTLLKLGANQQQLDSAISWLGELCIDSVCDRSVQGTMNQMKGSLEHLLWYDNADVTELSGYLTGVWLSDRPCTVKGQKECIWPQKAMLGLLGNNTISEAVPDNVIAFKNHKR
ncbi:MAG: hypothetical protein KAT90_12385 [Gammaproteobacteria bacterium]|nr:hypothetical protein [Gammaproteobacteria bacterium]